MTMDEAALSRETVAPDRVGAGRLRTGCYLLSLQPADDPDSAFDGTLRVVVAEDRTTASGDLYRRPAAEAADSAGNPVLAAPPDAALGIPVLPIDAWACYLRVTELAESGDGISVAFDEYWYRPDPGLSLDGTAIFWQAGRTFTATLMPDAPEAPAGPDAPTAPGGPLAGDLLGADGGLVGRLEMRWVSAYLRRATLEIDRVSASELPDGNGAGVTWRSVFDEVGIDMTVLVGDDDVTEVSGESWSPQEAHFAMLEWREPVDLNAEWHYHCLAVRRIHGSEIAQRGWMYDTNLIDVDALPREGLMVASHWPIPSDPAWGRLQGLRFGATPLYFRDAVHELGHALGLEHLGRGTGFMQVTESIITAATPEAPFPDNISWSFGPDHIDRLRHWPDPVVRPGGLPFGAGAAAPPLVSG